VGIDNNQQQPIVAPSVRTKSLLTSFDETHFTSLSTLTLLYIAIGVLFGLTISAIIALCFFFKTWKNSIPPLGFRNLYRYSSTMVSTQAA